jgi:hypothetical protein
MEKDNIVEKEVVIKKSDVFNNIHDLIRDLDALLKLTDEQKFLVTAKIKRYVHGEKANVYHRVQGWATSFGHEKGKNEFLEKTLELKVKTHEDLVSAPDEEIVTWDVGTHKWKSKQ